MHSAIFVASIPAGQQAQVQWAAFLTSVDAKTKSATNILRLAENVWLVNVQAGVGPLGHLVSCAENQSIAYGLLPFEQAPQWLPGGFDPKTIQGQNV